MFEPVNNKVDFASQEEKILKYWEEMEFIGGFEFLTQNREIQKILILFPGENAEDFKDPT